MNMGLMDFKPAYGIVVASGEQWGKNDGFVNANYYFEYQVGYGVLVSCWGIPCRVGGAVPHCPSACTPVAHFLWPHFNFIHSLRFMNYINKKTKQNMMEVHWTYENGIMKIIILYRSCILILKQSLLLGDGTLYIYLLSLLTKICPHDFSN